MQLEEALRADSGNVLVQTQIQRDDHSKKSHSVCDIDHVVPKSACTLWQSVEVAPSAGSQPFRFLRVEFEAVGGHPVADCCHTALKNCNRQICVISSTAEIQLIVLC